MRRRAFDPGALGLPRWLAGFPDPAAEAAFQEDQRPRMAAQLRLLALVPGAYVAALPFDLRTFGLGRAFGLLAALRLAVWGLVGLSGALARPGRPLRAAQHLLFAGVALVFVTEAVEYRLLAAKGAAFLPGDLAFPVLFVLGTYMMLPLGGRLCLGAALGGTALYLACLLATGGAAAAALPVLYLLFAHGIGLAFRVTWNRTQRRDFVLRARLEREIRVREAAEAQARRANEARSRFLAMMSHEIRTPLNGILGGVQLLQAPPVHPGQRQALELLARNGEVLARLLEDLLDLAWIESGRLRVACGPFSPAALLAGVHADLESRAAAKGLALRLEQTGPLAPALAGDAPRLRQVLVNLAGNAVKFTDRGEVVVSVAAAPVPGRPGLARCVFEVRDTGPGLDAQAQVRVFASFEQGDRSIHGRHGGAGLGLPISRQLVAAMGGELTLESAPGRGCRFAFSLDLPLAEPAGPEAAPEAQADTRARSLDLLVVDDLEGNRIVAQGLLERLGHRCWGADGAARTLELLAQRRFDAVLLDLHMQGMDGLGTLRAIRALGGCRTSDLPVFLVSADTDPARLQACLDAGAAGVLPKPLRLERLAALLAGLPGAQDLVDPGQAARIRRDLGEAIWGQGLRACRSSLEACLEGLARPEGQARALHGLAGLAGSYALPALHRLARRAEAALAAGEACPVAELHACGAASMRCLEELEPEPQPGIPAQSDLMSP